MCRLLLLIAFSIPGSLFPQKGILPFTGIVFESKGIFAENIDATLNGETWTSNKLPLNAEMKILATRPRGFTTEDGLVFPGVQVLVLTMTNDTLVDMANIMGEQSAEGVDSAYLNKLSVILTFEPGNSKPGDSLRIISRFFDTKGPAYLWTKLDLVIIEDNLPLATTTSTNAVSVRGQYKAISSGVEIDNISAVLYESVGFNSPKEKIRFEKIAGLTKEEFDKGSIELFTYDSDLQSHLLSLKTQHLNQRNGKVEKAYEIQALNGEEPKSIVLNLDIPLDGDVEFIRVRWESGDKQKVFDLVTTVN